MAISSTINVTSNIENYTLAELLELLGAPKNAKTALAGLEKAAKKNADALVALNAAEATRRAKIDADNAQREQEIIAIAKDRDALAAAWGQLKEDTATHDANTHKQRQELRKDQGAFKSEVADADASMKNIASERRALELARRDMEKEAEHERIEAQKLRDDAAEDLAAAKAALAEADAKIAEMRKLVA